MKGREEVEIFEENLHGENNSVVGKFAILRCGLSPQNPKAYMDLKVSEYVKHKNFSQFIDVHCNNTYVCVIISGINNLPYKAMTDADSL